MEEYVGKICPFCKTEIKSEDAIKVCPACGIPHHEGCWAENKGCTTFGCSEQHYEPQGTNPTDVCENCGATLGDGQLFCSKCGTQKNAVKSNICSKCGAELQDGQEFCSKCGQKVGVELGKDVNDAIGQFNANVDKENEAKKKKPMKIIIGAVVAFCALILMIVIAPKIFVSVEKLCAQGNYEKAYEKAKGDEKKAVKVENLAAVLSAISSEELKDPSSFELRDVYYNEYVNDDGEEVKRVVLYISGANSYGAKASSYWLYGWDDEDQEWSYWNAISDFEEEEYSSYDSSDEKIEKLYNNLCISIIETAMEEGYKLGKDGVKRINASFEQDILDEVELLDLY